MSTKRTTKSMQDVYRQREAQCDMMIAKAQTAEARVTAQYFRAYWARKASEAYKNNSN